MITLGTQNLVINKGADFSIPFEIDVNGEPLDISTYTILSQIRTQANRNAPLIYDFTVTQINNTRFELSLTYTQTASAAHTAGFYDVLLIDGNNRRKYYLRGSVAFADTVTVAT